ncbi:MAG: cell wall-binding repeat-containing protein, partial [Acidobacteriota bacterium]|nr:cell wall-binding repeat-containing protein [Acidobacteriota bacterium]
SLTTIYGANGTADGTVAAEFESAFPVNATNQTGGNSSVVLATDAAQANGSDALAASYLEGTLGTGLLITPSTTLGADAKAAIQLEGVTTVYVVGGPLAISPAVIAQIQALPAYKPGGLVQTGSNVTVVGPIYGADGTAAGTAAAIATRYGTAYGVGSFAGAYNATGGLYNDTTGTASTTAPTGFVPTAIVVASTDWQDAMTIAPEAYRSRFPVILAGPSSATTLGADAQAALTSLGVKQVILIGGQLAVQNSVEAAIAALNGGISVLRIAGIDATDTAAQIANFALANAPAGLGWNTTSHNTVIASHADYWSDALGAAALGGGANNTFGTEPIILTENPTTVGQYTTAELATLAAAPGNIVNLTVLGGPLAMPSTTVNTLLAGL